MPVSAWLPVGDLSAELMHREQASIFLNEGGFAPLTLIGWPGAPPSPRAVPAVGAPDVLLREEGMRGHVIVLFT